MNAEACRAACDVAEEVGIVIDTTADTGDAWLAKWRRCGKRVPATVFDALTRVPLEVDRYLMRFFRYAKATAEVFLHALIYIDRFTKKRRMRVTHFNKFRLLLAAVVLAEKFCKDAFYRNDRYAKISGVSLQELNQIEREFLLGLDWELFVTEEELRLCRARLARAAQECSAGRGGSSGDTYPQMEPTPPPADLPKMMRGSLRQPAPCSRGTALS
eukprot:TRINITY_DN558_c0_g1_i1.p1 TRINITY_DN558_c0_g1~~TRINITY_DN558_c0_g1_i1.p1  ORF type:complete len:215 (+),score=91.56 TRINITY_DN558_c0_g1_i1:50-694(+)